MEILRCHKKTAAIIKEFQLGHVFSDMEIGTVTSTTKSHIFVFQLGHVFSDMEISEFKVTVPYRNCGVSIGPRLFRHGNRIRRTRKRERLPGFNWATSFQTWKYERKILIRSIVSAFQLGHVFSDMEIG